MWYWKNPLRPDLKWRGQIRLNVSLCIKICTYILREFAHFLYLYLLADSLSVCISASVITAIISSTVRDQEQRRKSPPPKLQECSRHNLEERLGDINAAEGRSDHPVIWTKRTQSQQVTMIINTKRKLLHRHLFQRNGMEYLPVYWKSASPVIWNTGTAAWWVESYFSYRKRALSLQSGSVRKSPLYSVQ